jgi:hypothetical protein
MFEFVEIHVTLDVCHKFYSATLQLRGIMMVPELVSVTKRAMTCRHATITRPAQYCASQGLPSTSRMSQTAWQATTAPAAFSDGASIHPGKTETYALMAACKQKAHPALAELAVTALGSARELQIGHERTVNIAPRKSIINVAARLRYRNTVPTIGCQPSLTQQSGCQRCKPSNQ